LEAFIGEPNTPGTSWVAKLVEILQPLSVRGDQLGSMPLFKTLRWSELEGLAAQLDEVSVPRGTRLTVQGRTDSCFWLIVEGEALVSADARPLRVAGHGDAVGVAGMLYGIRSPETTIALGPMRTLMASPAQFRKLISTRLFRQRLTALAGDQLLSRRAPRHRPAGFRQTPNQAPGTNR
jgi:CRP-like cAMP-binding protein